MNDKELLELLAENAPQLPPDYPLTTLKRARRARRMRTFAIGGTATAVALMLFATAALRSGGGPSLPPAEPDRTSTAVVYLNVVSEAEKVAVQSVLENTPGVSKVTFVSREKAYEAFAKEFAGKATDVTPKEMPEWYEFETSSTVDRRGLLYRLRDMPGVGSAATPDPRKIVRAAASPSHGPVPEMGPPEAQLYSEQLILLVQAVWQRATRPKIYLVDGFCPVGWSPSGTCTPQRFSPTLRSLLEAQLSGRANVVFVEATGQWNPFVDDGVTVTLGALPARDAHDPRWWLKAENLDHHESAEFEVSWNGERWVAGQWVAGGVG